MFGIGSFCSRFPVPGSLFPTAVASGLPVVILAGVLIASTPASAQRRLPEPRIFGDELPPSSPSSLPSLDFPRPSTLPPASPNLPPPGRELNFQAPPPSRTVAPTRTANLYRVDIAGDSSWLLAQVQQIEPDAFIREEEGVIQAGVFADRYNAQSRVQVLQAQGIPAQITTVAVGGGIGTVDPGEYPRERYAATPSRRRAYYVIIPGSPADLPGIADRVIRLGVRRNAVSQREVPRGAHIAIGPFDNRGEADRWNSYFRAEGMDARVYFGN